MLKWKATRLRILGSVAVAAALALPTGSAMAAGPSPAPYTCSGGAIDSGTYASITVTGFCGVVPNAEITIVGNLNVAAGAFFDAQSAPSTITVGHNVTAAAGSLMGLGCQPPAYVHNSGHACTDPFAAEHSTITVSGNVTATGADTILLNGVTVMGNVTLSGGGGDIPWSIKNNTIAGNLTVDGVTADWLGVLFDHIGKNATLTNITVTDPSDPGRRAFVVQNTIGRNLTCMGIDPGVAGGLFPGEPKNIVGRNAIGQCAPLV